MYADDVLMFRSINTPNEHQTLLRTLAGWLTTWLPPFNLTKCDHLTVTNKLYMYIHRPITIKYHTESQIYYVIQYLSLTISTYITQILSWSEHISKLLIKANSVLGFLRRNLGHCTGEFKVTHTKRTYIIEYAAVIWSPYLHSNVSHVEMIQRRAARFLHNDFSRFSTVTQMLNEHEWPSYFGRTKKPIMLWSTNTFT